MFREESFFDHIVISFLLIIGVAQTAHLAGLFLHWEVGRLTVLFAAAVIVVLCGYLGLLFLSSRKMSAGTAGVKGTRRLHSQTERWLLLLLACVILWQLVGMITGKGVYRDADMTTETAVSFLQTNHIYSVNPLTGKAYELGMPLRLQILCLPTLYAALSKITGLEPAILIQTVIPCFVLLCSYAAYACLAKALFPDSQKKRLLFLLAVALLLKAGNYAYGFDGFGLLSCGFRGVTIRNTVLIPYTFSLMLRKKYVPAALCVIAEACITWTLYGLGMCLMAAVVMWVISRILQSISNRKCGEEAGL